jgi:hypothetical protein
MKMKRKLLPAVSVFFCILILASCGIATLFYVSYSFSDGDDNGDSVSGTFSVSSDEYDNLSLIETDPVSTGPSLMLFYVLSNDKDISYSTITTKFSTTYKTSPYGKIVATDSDGIVLSTDDYDLYAFSDTDETTIFSAPEYIYTCNDPYENSLEFTLTTERDTSSLYDIAMTQDSSENYTIQAIGNLCRYNGEKFLSDTGLMDAEADYSKSFSSSEAQADGEYYCHVFGAFCVSEGEFNNIFWTNLVYLGYLNFPIITS